MKHRHLTTRDGTSDLSEPEFHCVSCERSFFPQRVALPLDGSDYSPPVLERIAAAGGTFASFGVAAKMLELLTNLKISTRTINNDMILIGRELQAARDSLTDTCLARPITQPPKIAEPAVSLAVIQVDSGRMQTREAGQGSGVHGPHWRESKNAGLSPDDPRDVRQSPPLSFPRALPAQHQNGWIAS